MPIPPPPEGFEALDLEALSPEKALQIGVQLFNDAHYWYAHEVWESAWKQIPSDGRILYQALIQFAAALHHAQQENRHGFSKLLERATTTLGLVPGEEARMDMALLRRLLNHTLRAAENHVSRPILSDYPQLPQPVGKEV